MTGILAATVQIGFGMNVTRNEQTKLTAAFLNTVAVAIIVAGTIAPLFGIRYGLASLTPNG